MCSSLTVSNFISTIISGSDRGVGLDMRSLISLSCSVAPPKTDCDQTWVEVRLEAKTDMCVQYGTEATVQGSQVASIRLMVRLSEIRTKENNKTY